jgi:hypothetical protein
MAYRPLVVNEHLAKRYPSQTTPVTIERMSTGFEARVVVALFPENHIDGIQKAHDLIFYFIDKFIERHNRITKKMLAHVTSVEDFPILHHSTEQELEEAACHWVWLHEFFHRQGPMPIPDFLDLKSPKPLAGLEELRVDLSGMLVCHKADMLPPDLAARTWEFILAERLLRYSVEGIPRPNYDAVASQVLFNFLLEYGGIYLKGGRIRLSPDLHDVVAEFLRQVHDIEILIETEDPQYVQRTLISFANRYARYDVSIGDYRHIGFFSDVKRRLNV